ncbi:MAG: low molecular weight phosphotyrosine protein phosphatase [Alphaproteobacteria bacterium]|nr:low molecular weight phosphotyrosine protein phosphatase [Alphaproteobacteria bacterium]MCA0448528.1 low molecular weight phosphotyrosine protein phosphatase [Pseudomonadota bacterium]
MTPQITSLLFVCTGNICRSPTAEGVMRKMAQEAGLSLRIESRATHGYHIGEPPDPRTVRHAAQRGYDLTPQRAKKLAPRDFAEFDLILACDSGHYEILESLAPEGTNIAMFRADGNDVPDPYYGGPNGFDDVLDIVERECARLIRELR